MEKVESSSTDDKPPSSSSSSAAATGSIQNPYLKHHRPSVPASGDANPQRDDGPGDHKTVRVPSNSSRGPIGEGNPLPSNTLGDRRSPVEEKKDDGVSPPPADRDHGSKSADGTTATNTSNTGLAYWERLASKNLSHGSAEILTIEECIKHCSLYRGQSVRVTGQLHSRNFIGDDIVTPRMVLLELMDPAVAVPLPPPTSAIKKQTPAKSSILQTPGKPANDVSSDSNNTARTPGSAISTAKTPYKTPLKTIGPRKSMSASSSLLKTTSEKTPGSTTLSLPSKRKRPWFATSSRKKTPPKTVPRSMLRVVVDPEVPRISEIAPCGSSKVLALGVMMDGGLMQARFVSLVKNDLDMTIYVQSLENRRRCLYQRHKAILEQQQQQRTNDGSGTGAEDAMTTSKTTAKDPASSVANAMPKLLLGCGPPPYERYEQPKETETS